METYHNHKPLVFLPKPDPEPNLSLWAEYPDRVSCAIPRSFVPIPVVCRQIAKDLQAPVQVPLHRRQLTTRFPGEQVETKIQAQPHPFKKCRNFDCRRHQTYPRDLPAPDLAIVASTRRDGFAGLGLVAGQAIVEGIAQLLVGPGLVEIPLLFAGLAAIIRRKHLRPRIFAADQLVADLLAGGRAADKGEQEPDHWLEP